MSTFRTPFIFLMACMLSFGFLVQNVFAEPSQIAALTVRTSQDSDMETKLEIVNHKSFDRLLKRARRKTVPHIPLSDTHLTLTHNGEISTFLVDPSGHLFDEQTGELIEIQEKLRSELIKLVQSLRASHYGRMVEWKTASSLIPKKAKFKVIDMETGLSFNVQRRAGNKHADVQPLTKEDTAIMKQIYNGTWSWQRKAIAVQTEDQLLAASMHGMPHGGDGIPDNNFPGHFCIHFLGSATHGSGNVDPEHQLMVYKAAGQLDGYLKQASPYQLVDAFLAALNLKESNILRMSFTHAKHSQLDYFLQEADKLKAIRKKTKHVEKPYSDLLTLEIPVEVSITRETRRAEQATFTFQVTRESLTEPWKIESIGMIS